jgi:hypothetical protein
MLIHIYLHTHAHTYMHTDAQRELVTYMHTCILIHAQIYKYCEL